MNGQKSSSSSTPIIGLQPKGQQQEPLPAHPPKYCEAVFQSWPCTRTSGHDGDHESRGESGMLQCTWYSGGYWLP